MSDIKCPLCDSLIDPERYIRSGDKRQDYFECKNCGKYSIIDESFRFVGDSITKATLSYWINKNQDVKKHPHLTPELVENILQSITLPELDDQVNNLILYIGQTTTYGKPKYITLSEITARIGSIDKNGLLFVFDEINSKEYIKVIKPKVGRESLMNKDVRVVLCSLTSSGWQKYKELTSQKDYNFKNHKLTNDEKLWLTELWKFNFEKVEPRSVKVNLADKLSSSFNPSKIDWRFARENRITLLGLWYLEPHNPLFKKADQVIQQLKDLIKREPKLNRVDSNLIVSLLDIPQRDVQIVFTLIWDLGFCNGGGFATDLNILDYMTFNPNPDAFDKILYYKNLEDSLENFFNQHKPQEFHPPITTKSEQTKKKPKPQLNQELWKQIAEEFKTNQIAFGRKINFVKDQYTRRIIFRDIEDAYTLYKKGFSKAAIILAGGVIEELLRIYLLTKGHTFKKNKFFEYVELCETNNYLRAGARGLTDSARDYRNLVHLENEAKTKTEPTQSMASGAVSAIFTIADEF